MDIEERLNVYDVLGREMATLVQAKQMARTNEVKFETNKLQNGFYSYQLSAGSFVATNGCC